MKSSLLDGEERFRGREGQTREKLIQSPGHESEVSMDSFGDQVPILLCTPGWAGFRLGPRLRLGEAMTVSHC